MIRAQHLFREYTVAGARVRAVAIDLLALTCYLPLALLVTWTLALRFNTELFGGIDNIPGRFRFAGYEEAGLHLWRLWWVSEALLHAVHPFWTDLLFYPDGVQLYVQTLSAPNAVITLPIYLLAGPVAAFNTVIVLGFALTGFGIFLLARQYAGGFWGPLLCGVLVALGPFHLGQLQNSHNHLFSMQWIPLYLHALTLLDERGGRWRIGYAAGMATLVVLSDWYWASVCGVLTMVWMIIGGFIARRPAYPSFDIPLIRAIGTMQELPDDDITPLDRTTLMAMQCFAPVRHVVVRTDLTTQREQNNLEQTLTRLIGRPAVPAYEDAAYRRYELPLFVDACHPFMYPGKGWHAVERNTEMVLYRWADAESQVIIASPHTTSVPALVSLRLAAYQTTRPTELWSDNRLWGVLGISPEPRTFRLLLPVNHGVNPIILRAPTAPDLASNRMISIVAFRVSVAYPALTEEKR
ncbi:hypothetical protein [Roseiflexus sp.]|uniref:hypothetical protein n=1 Tax=Roseiflexus sp. TaxID=2562120 RepID=UPI0021DEABD0|nr:hypothetical protein [Roseiflexus sp.]GIW02960.1 MAG: hypothetical protein KatS3mg058_4363 [Roseiflexus sp.]